MSAFRVHPILASLALHAAVVCIAPIVARAQAGSTSRGAPLHIQSGGARPAVYNRTRLLESVEPGRTLTLMFALQGVTTRKLIVTPHVAAPEGWRVVGGVREIEVTAGSGELWSAGVTVPRGARAGDFLVRVSFAFSDGTRASDSVAVTVASRRALSVLATDRLSFASAGDSYERRFVVRNTGNADLDVRVTARASSGSVQLAAPAAVKIPAGGGVVVPVWVTVPRQSGDPQQVVELTAEAVDGSTRGTAAVRVAIVSPPETGSRFSTVPARLRIIGTTGGQRAAPIEFWGGGHLPDWNATVEFAFRPPAREPSIFSEPDEYRVALRTPRYAVTLGDHTHWLSPLTASGSRASGAGAELTRGRTRIVAYSSRSRLAPTSDVEHGASVGVRELGPGGAELTLNAVTRPVGAITGSVVSTAASGRIGDLGQVEGEYALSRSGTVSAAARRARVWGEVARVAYDFSRQAADTRFAGPQRGGTYSYAGVSVPLADGFRARAYRSRFGNEWLNDTLVTATQRHAETDAVALETPFNVSLELGRGLRHHAASTYVSRRFHYARASSSRTVGALMITGSTAYGTHADTLGERHGNYVDVSLSPALRLGRHTAGMQYAYVRGTPGSTSLASVTSAAFHGSLILPYSNSLTVNALGWRPASRDGDWAVQAQARLAHQLSNGATVAIRVYNSALVTAAAAPTRGERIVALEYGMPLRVPVVPSRAKGRATAIVADPNGVPVSGALVWLDGRAAVTDRSGRAHFSAMRAGTHTASLGAIVGAVSGRSRTTVHIDSVRTSPVEFRLDAGRGGRVVLSVASYAGDRTRLSPEQALETKPEPIAGVTVMLIGARDTLYQVSGSDGVADFGEVSSGRWTAVVTHGELPPFTSWESERIELSVSAGEERRGTFRLLPRRRGTVPSDGAGGELAQPVVLKLSSAAGDRRR